LVVEQIVSSTYPLAFSQLKDGLPVISDSYSVAQDFELKVLLILLTVHTQAMIQTFLDSVHKY
jgi:hypothetical protein